MQIINTKSQLQQTIHAWRMAGKTIGFVPTMGALHDGHLSLIDIAKNQADIVVCSIFVNPAQFAPHEDFASYPRTENSDLASLSAAGVNIAYLPPVEEMYASNAVINITTGEIGAELEGKFRPHFFDGVALVVTKLFMQMQPDIAVFGEKDYQQLVVVKKLVQELDIPVTICAAPICREADGLAMSSRNIYIPDGQRQIAAQLYKILKICREKISGGNAVETTLIWGINELLKAGFEQVDYLELRDAKTLMPLKKPQSPARLLVVARIAGVRLLDNIEL